MDAKKLLLIWKCSILNRLEVKYAAISDLSCLQRIFSAFTSSFKRIPLGRNHFQILSGSCLNRSEQQRIRNTDTGLLAQESEDGHRISRERIF